MSDLPFRVGMIGAGGKAAGHAKQLATMPELGTLTAVADVDKDRAEAVAQEHGAKAFTDYHHVFDLADVVLVVTPNHLHYEQTIAATEAGKHIFCEKPLSLDVSQAEEMVHACDEAKVELGTGFSVRFGAGPAEIVRLLHAGELGDPLACWDHRLDWIPPDKTVPWRLDPKQGGGVLYEYLTHEVDWLRVAGGKVRRVFGRKALCWSKPDFLANDHVWALFEYESGLTGTLQGSICSLRMEYTRAAMGTKGVAYTQAIPGQGHTPFIKRAGDKEPQRLDPPAPATALPAYFGALSNHEKLPADGQDGLAVTAICDAILQSAESGEAVEIPPSRR